MDLSWYNRLSTNKRNLLLGAGGSLAGGIGSKSAKDLLESCPKSVKSKFESEYVYKTLNLAIAEAMHATASALSDDEARQAHLMIHFSNCMAKTAVADELSQLITLESDTLLNMEVLEKSFGVLPYSAEILGREVLTGEIIDVFSNTFLDAVDKQPELRGIIPPDKLQIICDAIQAQSRRSQPQKKDLKQIITNVDPKLQAAWIEFFKFIQRQYEFLPLPGISGTPYAPQNNKALVPLVDVFIAPETTTFFPVESTKGHSRGPGEQTASTPCSAMSVFSANPRLVLLGKPGSGKSTFVHCLSLSLAQHHLLPDDNKRQLIPMCPEKWAELIPLPIALGDFAAWMEETHRSSETSTLLLYFIKFRLKQMGLEVLFEAFVTALKKGQVLLLFDGLDEVPAKGGAKRKIRLMLDDLPSAFPQTRMLVTCRILGYRESIGQLLNQQWQTFELADLGDDKILTFISDWYQWLAAKEVVDNPAMLAESLWFAIKKNDLLAPARTPFVLTMMVLVFARHKKLPLSMAMLYEQMVDLLLGHWNEASLENGQGGKIDLSRLLQRSELSIDDLKRAFWRLAFNAHRTVSTTASDDATADVTRKTIHYMLVELQKSRNLDWADQMLSVFESRAGLLVKTPLNTFRFPHRSFEEYLAACYLCILGNFADQALELTIQGTFWREVILLAVGRLAHHEGNINRSIALVDKFCGSQMPSENAEDAWCNIWMAGQCLLEMGLGNARNNDYGRVVSGRVQKHLAGLLEQGRLEARARSDAGIVLSRLGDIRKGVGLINSSPDIDWIQVTAGRFLKGSDKKRDANAADNELPQSACSDIHTAFAISRYPVSVVQYDCFVQADGYNEQRLWTAAGWQWRTEKKIDGPQNYAEVFQTLNHPRVGVSWFEATAFCNWLSDLLSIPIALPTENQWERAARGTEGRIYPWGDDFNPLHCNMAATGIGSTSAVGIFPAGNAPCGAADMSGNVSEWCRTKWRNSHLDHARARIDDLTGNELRVLRGGSFADDFSFVRGASRSDARPATRARVIGFRVVTPAS
jgi:formylglycine-generating enzyme required for sulfatase activity